MFKNKILSLGVVAVLMGSALFAVEPTFGAVVSLSGISDTLEATDGVDTLSSKESLTEFKFSGFADLTYAQFQIGYSSIVSGEVEIEYPGVGTATGDFEGTLTYLTFGAFGKYPYKLGSLTVFPLLGLEYKLNLAAEDADGNDLKKDATSKEKSDLNELWIKAGAGADFKISEKVYVRPSLVLGYRFLSELEQDIIADWDDMGVDASVTALGADFNLAVGFKL